jgi:hypothetical protein
MQRIVFVSVLALLCLTLVSQHATRAFDNNPSANGSFQFALEDGNTRYIEFNAQVHGNTARGTMSFSDPAATSGEENGPTGIQITANFDCMRVEGNRAVIGGQISSSNVLDAVGRRMLLIIEDNGEGVYANAPDRLTWGVYQSQETSWTPKDAEREDDNGASLSWIATDAERTDDVGIPSKQSPIVGCQTFPLSSYSFVDIPHGNGNLQIRQ